MIVGSQSVEVPVLCVTSTLINQVDRVARTSRPWVVSLVPEGIVRRLVRGTPNNGLFAEFRDSTLVS